MITLTIPGAPIAKKRPRFVRRGNFVGTYNCQETEEGRFLFEIQKQWARPVIEGPLRIWCLFEMPIPKGTSKKKMIAMDQDKIKHIKKPDIDNLVKFCCDCLNGVVWKDDSLIYSLHGSKMYSTEPKTIITIDEA